MESNRFDALTRAIDFRVPRRAALGGVLAGSITALTTRFGIDVGDAKKRKKKKKCKNCGPCKTCVKGKCKAVPNGEICGDNCEACLLGVCSDPACVVPDCLPNRTCASACDTGLQDCQNGCFCTGNTAGSSEAYCTVDPLPACASLTACSSIASCPSGHVCQDCDGANRCIPICPF